MSMTNKTVMSIMYVIGGMVWVFGFGMSKTKITDMWFLGMAAMITCHGLEMLVKDNDATTARLFGKMANISMFIAVSLLVLGIISRYF